MRTNVSGLLRNFASVRRAALAGRRVVVTTRDGNLVLMAEPHAEDSRRGPQHAIPSPDEEPQAVTGVDSAVTFGGNERLPARPPSAGARRFVSRAVIATAAGSAPRIDAQRFRADLDAMIDSYVDG